MCISFIDHSIASSLSAESSIGQDTVIKRIWVLVHAIVWSTYEPLGIYQLFLYFVYTDAQELILTPLGGG